MPGPDTLPPFPGFRAEAFGFLRGLTDNNRRDWFKPRKQVFEDEVDGPMDCLVADVSRRMAAAGLPLRGDPDASRFRIYRDQRFTDDPRPYKTHVSAVFDRSGRRETPGVVYVHVKPGGSYLAAGFYRPKARYLRPVRQRIAADPDAFERLLDTMRERGLPVTPPETLTGMPRGFAAHREAPYAALLKWKGYLVRRDVPDEALTEPAFAMEVVRLAHESMPLLEFVWSAHR